MTDLIDRSDVERVLRDPRFTVPEADAAAVGPMGRFRSLASRFANGPTHERRRAQVVDLISLLDSGSLADAAASRTRSMVGSSTGADVDVAAIARRVPVTCLAERLGFSQPDEAPALVADIAAPYASGAASDAADAAVARLLAAAPRPAAHGANGGTRATDDDNAVLRVQLLVQAFAATAALVEGAMRRSAAAPATDTTTDLLAATLRDHPPVRLTRRVDPDGEVLTLRLDGPDRDAGPARAPRALAFGAGPRGCPAEQPALAMAGAIVEELRAC